MKSKNAARTAQAKAIFSVLGKITTRSQFGGYGLLADGIMFAIIAEGELYLRAPGDLEAEFRALGMENMVYSKRGLPITMRYYWVDDALWQRERELLAFANRAIGAVRKNLQPPNHALGRLKDLPNIDISMERALWRAGIRTVYQLRLIGAQEGYLLLQQQQQNLGLKALLSLAGAIAGYHHAALPASIRRDMLSWFDSISARPAVLRAAAVRGTLPRHE